MSGLTYNVDIFQKFKSVFEQDRKFIQDWIVTWEYQDKRKKRKVSYEKGLPEEFYTYSGPKDLSKWVTWLLKSRKTNFLKGAEFDELVQASKNFDFKLFKEIEFEVEEKLYNETLGTNNAQDFYFENLIPSPTDGDSLKILDFGAGYGRQINLWSQLRTNSIFVGMDAIPISYCLQHFYYSKTGMFNQDYVLDQQNFNLEKAEQGIYHLPTWRRDLLPDNFFDKIILVQVLQELNPKLVKEMIKTFQRVLKPGGCVYIRDNYFTFRPVHAIDSEKLFSSHGFELEYSAHLMDDVDLHGIPRIWRKVRPEIVNARKIKGKQRMQEFLIDMDALTKGKAKSLVKKIVKIK